MVGVKIGGIALGGDAILAPMAGYGDIAFRRLARDFGAALTVTEMVSAKGLCYKNEKTEQLLRLAPNESPSCVQLFGSQPECFEKALTSGVLDKFDIIDINMGCPVGKVIKNGEGSALMTAPDTAARIVETCVKAAGGRPVTVKQRIGFSDDSKNAAEFARRMQSAGASAITVHGRTTAQLYRGLADWEIISQTAKSVSIPVFGNGDVTGVTDYLYRKKTSGCAGISIGRGALGHPGIFREIAGGKSDDLLSVALRHLEYALTYFPEYVAVRSLRKHLGYYLKGVPDTRELKRELNAIETADLLRQRLTEVLNVF